MALLLRTLVRQGRTLTKLQSLRQHCLVQPTCLISTSKKNEDTSTAVQPVQKKSEELKKLEEHFANTDLEADKNWVSYGYETADPQLDYFAHHVTMFLAITVCICWGSFILAYMPDYKLRSWCQREAYLELERREREGLPLVSPDYVDPSKINLPSDEEFAGEEIIV
ncbi:hypothetical protein C0Q70_15396 [Pomacea canaliculata]|uniref:NADH dehydrogenase [ubiquinone] 1 beta subcomplex subunit 11, mitochondrial n=1 Tax=Pomacea canaliculata TaxID=400727 RepID=A0A2T7NUR1_POMCA|nr:NADH dehydrogenase [ubiquinone] 1 beta subcomplex subunit 11, mitochondrial-like [Pomacea canaliculata]PVD24903.1 hypothetical protein C0Q70_15396 [Pomacea canaliculata]